MERPGATAAPGRVRPAIQRLGLECLHRFFDGVFTLRVAVRSSDASRVSSSLGGDGLFRACEKATGVDPAVTLRAD